ncbi:hypothetical protein F0562_023856 [Nyssa sinensis]|uniref:Uncharacterized protein n=1 Tax=Nyssa sinensis TaxID=561372 RepID=A0A5J5BHN5_9ASTE|nr:hypothetical protein F0562_023856 [Nyssa sinensis]
MPRLSLVSVTSWLFHRRWRYVLLSIVASSVDMWLVPRSHIIGSSIIFLIDRVFRVAIDRALLPQFCHHQA